MPARLTTGGLATMPDDRRTQAIITMQKKAAHRMMVVKIWRYLVLVTLKKTKGPTTRVKPARKTR